MKQTRLLVHYLNRLSSNPHTADCCQRLSVLKAQIQKTSKSYYELPNPLALRQRLSQWPLSLSYYNRLASLGLTQNYAGDVSVQPSWQLRGRMPFLYSSDSKGFDDLGDALGKRRERLQNANRRLKEKKENLIKDLKETQHQMKQRMDEIISKENIYTIPNLLCMLRIGSAPVLGYMILTKQYEPAIGIFAFAGITDLLDGYIARTVPGQASVFGSFLDPLADKILVATLFISLTCINLIPVPLTALIIFRDAGLVAAAFYIRFQSLEPPRTFAKYFDVAHPSAQLAPTFLSKVNTGLQLGLIGATLVSTVIPYDVSAVLTGMCWCTATTTLGSGISYMFAKDTFKIIRNGSAEKEDKSQCQDQNQGQDQNNNEKSP